jgi:DNA replication protein DnaC
MTTDLGLLAKEFRLHGILAHIDEIKENESRTSALQRFLSWEQSERTARKYKASMRATHLHRYCPFDSVAKFDWTWPRKIDKGQISELFTLEFLKENANVIFFGPSGVGKTTLAKNLIESAASRGKNAVFMESADLLDELLSDNNRYSMRQRIEKYAKPELLAIDEVGYLSYDTRHADVLFQLIQKRAGRKSTIITTNRPFGDWGELFPNAASVSALIDRLIERCEIVQIDADTYRGKRHQERKAQKAKLAK